MQDRKRLRERFDEPLWRWADVAAGVKSAADWVETFMQGTFTRLRMSVVATSEPGSR